MINIYTDATVMSGEEMCRALTTRCDTVLRKAKPIPDQVGFVSGFTGKLC